MPNTITKTVLTLSRPPMAPLNAADTHFLSTSNNILLQTNSKLYATANQCQTLYQPHIALDIGTSSLLPYSSSTVNPLNFSCVNTKNFTVPFVVMKKSVKSFDGLYHQFTPEKKLNEIDAPMMFIMGEQRFDPVAYNQCHKQKTAYTQCPLSVITFCWFLRLHDCYKIDWSAFVPALKKEFFLHGKLQLTHMLELRLWRKNKLKTYVIALWKFHKLLKRAGLINLLQLLTPNVMKLSLEDYWKNWKTLLKNQKSNIDLLLQNLPFHLIHWLDLLMLEIIRTKEFVLLTYHWNSIR